MYELWYCCSFLWKLAVTRQPTDYDQLPLIALVFRLTLLFLLFFICIVPYFPPLHFRAKSFFCVFLVLFQSPLHSKIYKHLINSDQQMFFEGIVFFSVFFRILCHRLSKTTKHLVDWKDQIYPPLNHCRISPMYHMNLLYLSLSLTHCGPWFVLSGPKYKP